MKAAFIGAGNRSVSHMAALTHLPDIETVAIAELDESRALESQERANGRRAEDSDPIDVRIFNDYRDMIDTVAPDCIYLCLPPFVHGQLDHDVIDYGLPVLFEKPVAVEMSVANEIAAHVAERASSTRRAIRNATALPCRMPRTCWRTRHCHGHFYPAERLAWATVVEGPRAIWWHVGGAAYPRRGSYALCLRRDRKCLRCRGYPSA